jgi:hypothetical protein
MLYDPKWQEPKTDVADITSRILRTAGDIMKMRGWCRHTAQNAKGEVCSMGAMELAIRELGVADWLLLRAERRLQRQIGVSMHYVCWNDAVCKNEEQAVAALYGAAALPELM